MRKHKLQAVALLAAMLTQTSLVCAVDAAEADGVAACASEQDDARRLECYDRAIAADGSLTIAYLQKGGLFNRMERYEEALQCYEQALHAQENAHAS